MAQDRGLGVSDKQDPERLPNDMERSPPGRKILPEIKVKAEDVDFVNTELDRWVKSGYVMELTAGRRKSAKIVLPAFVIISGGKKRLVIDARYTNQHCEKSSIKYEDLRDLSLVLRPQDHLISFDIKDGYHHLSLRKDAQRHLCFRI